MSATDHIGEDDVIMDISTFKSALRANLPLPDTEKVYRACRKGASNLSEFMNDAFELSVLGQSLVWARKILADASVADVSIRQRDDRGDSLLKKLMEDRVNDYGVDKDFTNMCDWLFEHMTLDDPIGNPNHNQGIAKDRVSKNRMRPIHWAVASGNESLFVKLMSLGVSPNGMLESGDGWSGIHPDELPTYVAVKNGNYGMFEKLVAAGANPSLRILNGGEQKTDKHPSALKFSIMNGLWEPVSICLKYGSEFFAGYDGKDTEGVFDVSNPSPLPVSEGAAKIWLVGVVTSLKKKSANLAGMIEKQELLRKNDSLVVESVEKKRGLFDFLRLGSKTTEPPEKFDEEKLIRWKTLDCLYKKDAEGMAENLALMRGKGYPPPTVMGMPLAYFAGIFFLCDRNWNPESGDIYAYGNRGFIGGRLACLRKIAEFASGEDEFCVKLRAGFSYETPACDGMSLAHWAVMFDEPFALNEFLSLGVDWKSSPAYASAEPAVLAIRKGRLECVKTLLAHGMEIGYPSPLSGAFGESVRCGSLKMLEVLLKGSSPTESSVLSKEALSWDVVVPEMRSMLESFALLKTGPSSSPRLEKAL